jgi:hypothetical protein
MFIISKTHKVIRSYYFTKRHTKNVVGLLMPSLQLVPPLPLMTSWVRRGRRNNDRGFVEVVNSGYTCSRVVIRPFPVNNYG